MELTDKQVARLDGIYNAVRNMIADVMGYDNDWWDMEYIGEIADSIEIVMLAKKGSFCYPCTVENHVGDGQTNCMSIIDEETGNHPCGYSECLCK